MRYLLDHQEIIDAGWRVVILECGIILVPTQMSREPGHAAKLRENFVTVKAVNESPFQLQRERSAALIMQLNITVLLTVTVALGPDQPFYGGLSSSQWLPIRARMTVTETPTAVLSTLSPSAAAFLCLHSAAAPLYLYPPTTLLCHHSAAILCHHAAVLHGRSH